MSIIEGVDQLAIPIAEEMSKSCQGKKAAIG